MNRVKYSLQTLVQSLTEDVRYTLSLLVLKPSTSFAHIARPAENGTWTQSYSQHIETQRTLRKRFSISTLVVVILGTVAVNTVLNILS